MTLDKFLTALSRVSPLALPRPNCFPVSGVHTVFPSLIVAILKRQNPLSVRFRSPSLSASFSKLPFPFAPNLGSFSTTPGAPPSLLRGRCQVAPLLVDKYRAPFQNTQVSQIKGIISACPIPSVFLKSSHLLPRENIRTSPSSLKSSSK